MCGAPANVTSVFYYMFPGYFANILITGLQPDTRYFIVYGSEEEYLSEEVAFTTAKMVGADIPVRLAAFGDMALSVTGALKTVHQVLAKYNLSPVSSTASAGIDAILHFGDLGYAFGSTGNVVQLNLTQYP